MIDGRIATMLAAALLVGAACSTAADDRSGGGSIAIPGVAAGGASGGQSGEPANGTGNGANGDDPSTTTTSPPAATASPAPATASVPATASTSTAVQAAASTSTAPSSSPSSTVTSTSAPTTSTTSTAPSTSSTTTTSTAPSTTTTVPLPDDVYDPACVMRIRPGDSLGLIAERFDDQTVTAASIAAENNIADVDLINAGALLDVCVDNGLDDITGEQRLAPNEVVAATARQAVVMAQQTKLNELFDGYGIRPLLVDGISGPVTQQRLCAFRVARGLPVSRADMEAGSLEEVALMFATELTPPASSALSSSRWALVDLTCQVMFAGGPGTLEFVFPASSGEAGHETRLQDRSLAFRYDPAVANGGWHNSTDFPVAVDNPLNGNMYKPIYFDGGQAIHGSNNVPTTPQSKGCVRLKVADQDAFVAWLGLADRTSATWSLERTVELRVNVQGSYAAG